MGIIPAFARRAHVMADPVLSSETCNGLPERFPAELRERAQWMVAGRGDPLLANGEPNPDYKRPIDPKTGRWGSPTDPATWGTFEQAMASDYSLKGFVFNEDDPFAVIDLDTYKAKNDDQRKLHADILVDVDNYSQTYVEHSQSGKGTHIIGLGRIPEGANNQEACLEIYSHARFMICTGNVVGGVSRPVTDIQPLLDYLYPLVKERGSMPFTSWKDLGEGGEEVLTDAEVVERASYAENGDKFDALCRGDMSDHGNDHSKADMALLEFLCFYTPNNGQVQRIFMMSALGKRVKAFRPDYVPRSIAKARAWQESRAVPPVDSSAILERAKAVAAAKPATPIPLAPQALPAPVSAAQRPATFPTGLVGEIAEYVLASSTRPVPEIALATAIAVTAGIVGRNYNVSSTGLNQYILLLAKTGTGKESVQSTVDRLFFEVQKRVPAAERFLGPAHFSSGPALVKQFQERPCFVSILGEFGHRLKAMTHPRANGAEKTLMAAMLDIYAKSGWGQMLRASVYSDKEKNTTIVHAPSLTLLGESEPDGFFAALDEPMIASGFLPRFMVIEYKGERPRRNKAAWTSPPPELVTKVAGLCSAVLTMEQNNTCTVVAMDPAALVLLDQFDEYADGQMRGSSVVSQQLWNRAHLKAIRLSTLIAVGVNPQNARVMPDHAEWAIDLVMRDVSTLLDRFVASDVGEGDSKQRAELIGIIARFLANTKGKSDPQYRVRGCISKRFLSQSVNNRPAFKNDRRGANKALSDLLTAMSETGEIQLVPKKEAYEWFKTSAMVYCLGDRWSG